MSPALDRIIDCILSSFVFHQIFRYNVCEYLELRLAGNVVPNLHKTFPPPALNLNWAYLYKSLIIFVLSYLIKSPVSEANLLNDQKRWRGNCLTFIGICIFVYLWSSVLKLNHFLLSVKIIILVWLLGFCTFLVFWEWDHSLFMHL